MNAENEDLVNALRVILCISMEFDYAMTDADKKAAGVRMVAARNEARMVLGRCQQRPDVENPSRSSISESAPRDAEWAQHAANEIFTLHVESGLTGQCEEIAAIILRHAPADSASAQLADSEAFTRLSARVANKKAGEYGEFTDQDWQDISALAAQLAAMREERDAARQAVAENDKAALERLGNPFDPDSWYSQTQRAASAICDEALTEWGVVGPDCVNVVGSIIRTQLAAAQAEVGRLTKERDEANKFASCNADAAKMAEMERDELKDKLTAAAPERAT